MSCRLSRASRPFPAEVASDAIWTVPNALSVLRLLGVPVFLWLLLGPHADLAALLVLAVAGFTDWLDGVLARALNQTSRLGALLDPAADRLYILTTLIGLVLRDIIPWWLAAILVGRDLLLLLTVPGLRRLGLSALPVNYLGKAATFALLYAFPLLLLGAYHGTLADIAQPDRLGVHAVGDRHVPLGRRGLRPAVPRGHASWTSVSEPAQRIGESSVGRATYRLSDQHARPRLRRRRRTSGRRPERALGRSRRRRRLERVARRPRLRARRLHPRARLRRARTGRRRRRPRCTPIWSTRARAAEHAAERPRADAPSA